MPTPSPVPQSVATPCARVVAKLDTYLTPQRLRVYPSIIVVAMGVALVLARMIPNAPTLLPDYAARWSAGRLLLTGRLSQLYDPGVQAALQHADLGSAGLSWFVSPPFVAALFAPLALLPYEISCLVWTGLSAGSLVLSLHLLRPWAPPVLNTRWPTFVLVTFASYPAVELLGGGQDTALVLLAVVGGMRLLSSGHDLGAGAVLAVGCIKPHLICLIPVLLLAQRRLRALGAFAITAAVWLVVSLSLVGVPSFLSWLSLPGSPLYSGAVQRGQAYKGVSASAWITDVGGPGGPSWWLALATFAGLALVVPGARTLFRGPLSVPMSLAVALFTTVVAAPHVMVYDLVLMLPALPVLAATAWTASTRVTLAGIFVLTWLTPLLHTVAGRVPWPLSLVGAPWAALLVVILWRGILREQRRSSMDRWLRLRAWLGRRSSFGRRSSGDCRHARAGLPRPPGRGSDWVGATGESP